MPTIEFMPDRLNAEPVVFRGFTTPELGITALLSAFSGLIIAIPIMPFLGWIALPTVFLLMPLITIILGEGYWRVLKEASLKTTFIAV